MDKSHSVIIQEPIDIAAVTKVSPKKMPRKSVRVSPKQRESLKKMADVSQLQEPP